LMKNPFSHTLLVI